MAFNNDVNAKQQGTQYLSTVGAWTGVDGGTAGHILTSNGTGVAPSFQAAASGSVTITGDSGSMSGSSLTLYADLAASNCGSTAEFVNSGTTSTLNVTDAHGNTSYGLKSGKLSTSSSHNCFYGYESGGGFNGTNAYGNSNCAFGYLALGLLGQSAGGEANNVAIGTAALFNIATVSFGNGNNNIAVGYQAGTNLVTGDQNVFVGVNSGINYTTTETGNIVIGNAAGLTAESYKTRIGFDGSNSSIQTGCYIDGIFGITVGVSGTAVVIDNTGNLGTVVSSIRYKENVKDIDKGSADIFSLRPVTFNLKSDKNKTIQVGLIAEEVEKIMPSLVTYNLEGKPESVKYHDLPVLLLNELLKLRKELDDIKKKCNIA